MTEKEFLKALEAKREAGWKLRSAIGARIKRIVTNEGCCPLEAVGGQKPGSFVLAGLVLGINSKLLWKIVEAADGRTYTPARKRLREKMLKALGLEETK